MEFSGLYGLVYAAFNYYIFLAFNYYIFLASIAGLAGE